ncbi:hypothetical protein ACC809_37520, partial [Rhizobium johnstonii]
RRGLGIDDGAWLHLWRMDDVGRARVMTDIAVLNAKADLVAGICFHNFVTAKDAQESGSQVESMR